LLAQQAGYSGVTVADGVEFNINSVTYRYELNQVRLKTILRDVVPLVRPDYVSYSSYDSQNRGRMEQDLRQIQGWLSVNSPPSRLGIGEVGYTRHGIDGIDSFRTVATALAVQRLKLPFAILWEAYDTYAGDRTQPFGILQARGQLRKVTRSLRAELNAQSAEMATNPDAKILAANDRLVSSGYRYYELYGEFPRGPFGATALCDGIDTPIELTFQGATQVNVRIPHQIWFDRQCTFRLWRSDGTHSLAFGPVVACKDGALPGPCFGTAPPY
jgi:hypothetical protein